MIVQTTENAEAAPTRWSEGVKLWPMVRPGTVVPELVVEYLPKASYGPCRDMMELHG
jgi:hypothetical protein